MIHLLVMVPWPTYLVIELAGLRLSSATPPGQIGWLAAGLLALGGLTSFVLWWSRRGRRDPFI